jgi:hypothetical protein
MRKFTRNFLRGVLVFSGCHVFAGLCAAEIFPFTTITNYDLGSAPQSLYVADFDNDGRKDLLVVTFDDAVNVLTAKAEGLFASSIRSRVNNTELSFPTTAAVGDFNQDGTNDIAVGNSHVASVTVLFGNGDGSFQTGSTYVVPSAPYAVVSGDLDHDGLMDLATANYDDGSVSVLKGVRDGSFVIKTNLIPNKPPKSVAVADVDIDGTLDVVATDTGANRMPGNTVTIFYGKKGVEFTETASHQVGLAPATLLVQDLNCDGRPEIITQSRTNTVEILINKGERSFAIAVSYHVGSLPGFLSAGDLNGDGKLDLVVSHGGYPDTMAMILAGQGNGALGGSKSVWLESYPFHSVIMDADGDRRPDLILAMYFQDTVKILRNDGQYVPGRPKLNITFGNREATVSWPEVYSRTHQLETSDAVGDGSLWQVVTNSLRSENCEQQLIVPASQAVRFFRLHEK